MSYELDSEEVVGFTFVEPCPFPQVVDGREACILPVRIQGADDRILSGGGVLKMVDTSESFFSFIHPGKAAQEIETFLIPEVFCQMSER